MELASVYKGQDIVFMEVNVDKHRVSILPLLRTEFDLAQGICNECNVRSMPTFLCYAHGDVVDEVIGPDKARLSDAVSKQDTL